MFNQFIWKVSILVAGVSHNVQLAVDVVSMSLKIAVSSFCNQADFTEKVTSAMFPFLLIQPKVLSCALHFIQLWRKSLLLLLIAVIMSFVDVEFKSACAKIGERC